VYRTVFERMGRVDWAQKILADAFSDARFEQWPPTAPELAGAYRARERRWRMENWRGRELEQPYLTREENLERVGDLIRKFWPEEPNSKEAA
jgi:hypothetical protein